MANYIASARSNYFAVKDEAEFLKELESIRDIVAVKQEETGKYMVHSDSADGSWPTWGTDSEGEPILDESGEEVQMDITSVIAKHLVDDEVAVFMEIGAEKLRYLNGEAIAVNNKGGKECLDLRHIYAMANELGKTITEVAY